MNDGLPHIIPGQPRRSMYGEHNTHDETVALTAAAYQRFVDDAFRVQWLWTETDDMLAEHGPIRVVAEVGRRIEP